jgi:EmrB/QacA subfamily drug resistance transporter
LTDQATSPTIAPSAARGAEHPMIVLLLCVSAAVLTGIGLSIMAVTFNKIAADFPDASAAQLSWIANLFTIVGAATLVPAGVLADRVGRRRMMLAGVAVFTAGSLLGALAPDPGVIMLARTVQALGASAYTPAAAAVLIAAFPPERLATAIGVWAVTGGVSSALGPSLGGLVVGWGGWRWAFWLNIPVGIFVLVFGRRYLPSTKGDRTRAIPDPFGALLTIVGISAITLAVVQNKQDEGWQWYGRYTLAATAFGLVILGWFVLRCRRSANPLLDLDLFRIPNVRRGVAGTFAIALSWFCINWGIVQFTMQSWGWTPFRAGVSTAPIALFSGIVGIYAGSVASRTGHRRFILPGCVMTILTAVFFLVTIDETPRLWSVIVPGSIMLGLSTGLVFPSFIATSLRDVPNDRHAVGSGINFMTQRIGTTFGVALAITFLASADGVTGLRRTLAVAIIGSVVCFLIGLRVDTRPVTEPIDV